MCYKYKIMKKLPVIITILILASCSTSSDVVQNGRINKRKYNKGFFIKSNTNNHSTFLSNLSKKTIWHKKSNTEKSTLLYADLNANSSHLIPNSSSNEILNKINNSNKATNYTLSETSNKKSQKNKSLKRKDFVKLKKLIKKEIIASKTEKKSKIVEDDDEGDNNEGDKSQIVTLILLVFLGYLGAHRFYLGDIAVGLLYLFTFGLCGVGFIIDLILLVTGKLKPKDGTEFYDKFI